MGVEVRDGTGHGETIAVAVGHDIEVIVGVSSQASQYGAVGSDDDGIPAGGTADLIVEAVVAGGSFPVDAGLANLGHDGVQTQRTRAGSATNTVDVELVAEGGIVARSEGDGERTCGRCCQDGVHALREVGLVALVEDIAACTHTVVDGEGVGIGTMAEPAALHLKFAAFLTAHHHEGGVAVVQIACHGAAVVVDDEVASNNSVGGTVAHPYLVGGKAVLQFDPFTVFVAAVGADKEAVVCAVGQRVEGDMIVVGVDRHEQRVGHAVHDSRRGDSVDVNLIA